MLNIKHVSLSWIFDFVKSFYPSLSLASFYLFFFDTSIESNAYWIEILKYSFGIIGSLALVIFTFYYQKINTIEKESKKRDEKLEIDLKDFKEKFEVSVERRVLSLEMNLKDRLTGIETKHVAEVAIKARDLKNTMSCMLLLREAINTGDKENLDLKLFLKD